MFLLLAMYDNLLTRLSLHKNLLVQAVAALLYCCNQTACSFINELCDSLRLLRAVCVAIDTGHRYHKGQFAQAAGWLLYPWHRKLIFLISHSLAQAGVCATVVLGVVGSKSGFACRRLVWKPLSLFGTSSLLVS